ncbi:RQC domain-containing protein [Kribbella sp. NPDC026596]|uniref:RQC domain-containing protein n=1 Tax=Kribbella sp. NPDC026596 TaxID=3155122 RepID=UPI003408760D
MPGGELGPFLQHERGQKFGAGQLIDILLGKDTEKVKQFRHEQLSVFGIGTELKDTEWRGVIRQLLALRLLTVEGDDGTLVLAEESGVVLGRRREVMMRREPERARSKSSGGKKAAAADLPAEAAPVFERLRTWRAGVAKEQGVPVYVIFHDATLRQIATDLPGTLAELGTISGIGENKLAKYGEGVLDALVGE